MSDLKRIEDKIDKIDDKIGSIDVTLAAQHVSLKDHIRRTQLLEEGFKPIQAHVSRVEGALKFIGALATLAAIAEAIILGFKK